VLRENKDTRFIMKASNILKINIIVAKVEIMDPNEEITFHVI
jgi:hypothetical protein